MKFQLRGNWKNNIMGSKQLDEYEMRNRIGNGVLVMRFKKRNMACDCEL